MRALSIRQPWAWCIVNGHKTVENRDWNTNVRGDVAIHAGKTYDEHGEDFIRMSFPAVQLPKREAIECGGIVGVARLVRVVGWESVGALSDDERQWFFGEFGFVFADARPVPFVPLKGSLGFFGIDGAAITQGGANAR